MWEAPGGKLDEGQDISQALEREVLEETGLLVIPTNRVAYIRSEMIIKGPYIGLPYIVLVGVVKIEGHRECKLSDEHTEWKWASYLDSLELELTPETRAALLALKSYVT